MLGRPSAPGEEVDVDGFVADLSFRRRSCARTGSCRRACRARCAAVPGGQDRRAPGVLAAVRRGANRGAGPVRGGGRAADHRSDGEPAAQRGGVPRRHPLGVGERAVLHHADLRAGHRPPRSPAGGPGATDPAGPAGAPDRATGDRPAALVLEPRPGGRVPLRGRVTHRDVGARSLDDPSQAARRPGRGQRVDLRTAGTAAAGAGGSPAPRAPRRDPAAGHQHQRQRALGVSAHLPQRVRTGDGRLRRHPELTPGDPPRLAHRRGRGPAPGGSGTQTRLLAAARDDPGRRRPRHRGPPAAHR